MISQSEIIEESNYYPFGLKHKGYNNVTSSNGNSVAQKFGYNGKELSEELGLQWHDFSARNYDASLGRWMNLDPLAEQMRRHSPYNYAFNNPIYFIDPDGMMPMGHYMEPYSMAPDDWVEKADGTIYWDDKATSQATTKEGETYLGKNVLVGTHNRDATGNEAINTAEFNLYLESDKTGPTATIMGNTVPADIEKFGTLAEGLYSAEYTTYKKDGAILINGGKSLPTVSGNPNNPLNYNADGSLKLIGEHIMDDILFHKGNWARKSLSTNTFRNGKRVMISEGCQTGGCGPRSLSKYRQFIKKAKDFKGSYYLRPNNTLKNR